VVNHRRPAQRYYHLHRPDVITLLAAALPLGFVQVGHRCVALTLRDGHVEAAFDTGVTARADVVLGADGIHSTVRALVLGPESPRFSGSIAYRGLAPVERLAGLTLPRAGAWLGPHRHVVHYVVGAGRFMNVVGIVPGGDWRVESWSAEGKVARAGPSGESRCLAARDPAPVPAALARYAAIRKPRASEVQRGSRANATTYHLADGGAQEKRDAQYAALAAAALRRPRLALRLRRRRGGRVIAYSASAIPISSSYSAIQYVSVLNAGKPAWNDASSHRRAIHPDM
jgi:salicylate hydroxylase